MNYNIEQITSKEIYELSSNLKKFIQYFEYNLDTMFGLVELIYLLNLEIF